MKLDHLHPVAGVKSMRAGFTVMEVLLALSLTVVVIGVMLGGVVAYTKANTAATTLESLNVTARGLEDQMKRDLALVSRIRTFTVDGACPRTITRTFSLGGGDDDLLRTGLPDLGINPPPGRGEPDFGTNPPGGDRGVPGGGRQVTLRGVRLELLRPTDGSPYSVDYLVLEDDVGIVRFSEAGGGEVQQRTYFGVEGFYVGCLQGSGQVAATAVVREQHVGRVGNAGQQVDVRVTSALRMR